MSEMLYDLFLLGMLFAVFAVGLTVVSAVMHVIEWVADELRRARSPQSGLPSFIHCVETLRRSRNSRALRARESRARKRRLLERGRAYRAGRN